MDAKRKGPLSHVVSQPKTRTLTKHGFAAAQTQTQTHTHVQKHSTTLLLVFFFDTHLPGYSRNHPIDLLHNSIRFKRRTLGPFDRLILLRNFIKLLHFDPELRRESLHRRPAADESSPITRLGCGSEIAVAESSFGVIGNDQRVHVGVRRVQESFHPLGEIAKVMFCANVVLLWSRVLEKMMIELDPFQIMGEENGVAVEQVFQSARIGVAFGLRDKLVRAVVLHRQEAFLDGGPVVPMEHLHICPVVTLGVVD